MIIISNTNPIKTGKILKLKKEASQPNMGGINVVPMYALPTCNPIIACE